MIQARVGDKFLGYLNCEPERLAGSSQSLLSIGGEAYMAPVRTKRESFKFKPGATAEEKKDEMRSRHMPRRALDVGRWKGYGLNPGYEHEFEYQFAKLEEDTAFILFVREHIAETDG